MRKSADLIQSNSQIYRVYTRRLANPADQDIFIASAGKLTNFLSDKRAYYAEAQQPIIEMLEVACNSLKSVAPSVFSNPSSMDRSSIPDDKAPLFDAFDKLVNCVTQHVDLFTGQSLNSRLRSFLSSISITLPLPETIDLTSPDSPTQMSTTSPTGPQVDSAPSQAQVEVSSQKGTTASDSMPMASRPSSTVTGPASDQPVSSVPTSAVAPVPPMAPVEVTSQQIQKSPASGSLGQPSSPQAPDPGNANNPVPAEPNQINQPPASILSTSSVSPLLHTQTSPPVSVPQETPVSSQKIVTTLSVAPSSASPKITPKIPNPQLMSPSLASAGQVGIAQAPQIPPPQAQAPKTPASPALASRSSVQQKPKPPPRRQSSGLNFLQLDLLVAREKKLKAALTTEQQKSASATQAYLGPVPSTSTATASAPAVTASPTSTAIADSPKTPAAPGLMSKFAVAAQAAPAGTPPFTGPTPVPTPATISDELSTTQQHQVAQTSSPSLVHRDLRQGLSRNSISGVPRKLRITGRAPAPPPEPGSSSAPIVIDEDDEPPADEVMEASVPTDALPALGKTVEAIDQGAQGNKVATGNDRKPQSDQVTSSPPIEPPATGISRTDVMATQSPSAPSISSPRPSVATPAQATPASGPSVPASLHGETTGVQPQQGKDDNELVKVAEGSAESLGVSITETVSGATVEPPSDSSPINMNSTHITDDTEMAPLPPATTATTTAGSESSAAQLASRDAAEPSLESNIAESHSTGEHAATIPVASASLETGKHQRSLTPPDGDTRRVIPRKASIPENQQVTPTTIFQSDIVGPTSAAPATLDAERRENAGGSETAVDPSLDLGQAVSTTPSVSGSNKGTNSMLPPPITRPHLRSESLSDMDISRSSVTPPPIVVLGTRSGGSNASSLSRSASPRSGNRPSEAGTELIKAEELDDEMVDELAPLFGKEMRVICMDRAWDVPGEFTWNFTLPQIDWDRVSQWANGPENVDSDISRVRCITLACYVMKELEPYASQDGSTREQWFENVKPVPWANLPPHLWAMINDKFYAVFPPYVSPDDLFDVSPFLQQGDNKITFTQIDGMDDYVLVLHGHYPTPGQLVPLHARWDQERSFINKLQWFARPFTIND